MSISGQSAECPLWKNGYNFHSVYKKLHSSGRNVDVQSVVHTPSMTLIRPYGGAITVVARHFSYFITNILYTIKPWNIGTHMHLFMVNIFKLWLQPLWIYLHFWYFDKMLKYLLFRYCINMQLLSSIPHVLNWHASLIDFLFAPL